MELKIGAKIKRLRAANNLTQEELALRADLTKGFISLVERDETSLSLDSLGALLEVFGITFAEFFTMEAEETEERVVFTRDDRVEITGDEGERIELLVPRAQNRNMDPVTVTLTTGGESADDPHEGEEFGIVLEGTVVLELEGHPPHPVRKGESFYFSSSRRHRVYNEGKKAARILWVVSPPTFH